MKKYILSSMLLVTILTGCEKKLEIAPYQSIDENKALLTEGDVKVTLIGAYDGIQSTAALGGDLLLMNELVGNIADIRFTGTFAGLAEAHRIEMTRDNTFARDIWAQCYNTINRCNNVLSAIDKVTSNAATKSRIEGEALFLRATMYFELVKLFAKAYGDGANATNLGVPLVNTPTRGVTDADYKARNNVEEVYKLVEADLIKAESLLPATNTIYATKNAAAAVLSRVALMKGDYATARDAANRVITSARQSLTATVAGNWFTFISNAGNNSSEYIFSMRVTTQDGVNGLSTYFGINADAALGVSGTAGRGDCKIQAAHIAKYEAGDARKAYFYTTGGNNYTRKHLDRYGNVCVARLAEMYLTRAESNFRLSTSIGATPAADVQTIRGRAGLAALTTVDLPAILNERYLELAFEGQRLADLKRTRTAQSGTAWNSPKLILPIPQREMDVNKQLVQNEGY